MKSKSRFQRSFLIFQKEDPGYGVGQGTSGYIKIEVRDGKGILFASVQNLRDGKDMYIYKLYLIEPKERGTNIAYVGVVPVEGNKGELKWAFDPDNVAETGSSIDSFEVAALLVEMANRKTFQIICPMAAYRDKKVSWRESFRRTFDIKAVKKNTIAAGDKERDIGQKLREDISFEAKIDENETEYITPEENELKEIRAEENEINNSEIVRSEILRDAQEEHDDITAKYDMDEVKESKADEYKSVSMEHESGDETEQSRDEEDAQCSSEGDVQDNTGGIGQIRNYAFEQDSSGETYQNEYYTYEEDNSSENGQIRNYADVQDSGGQIKQSGNYAGEQVNNSKAGQASIEGSEQDNTFRGGQNVQNGMGYMPQNNGMPGSYFNGCGIPCAACNLKMMEHAGNISGKTGVDLKKLESSFNQYFEKFDPFQNKRRDYKWWKIGSPVHLNNILYQHNIRTPLLFNPAVMMSHLKYRHMIAGIYKDEAKKIGLIVCGIPAVYDSDTRPFGDMCRWVQPEVGRPRYGAFGYWLVYIDPETGKFLSIK